MLTEKVARRSMHLTRQYATNPLEVFFSCEVMTPGPISAHARRLTVYADNTLREVAKAFARHEVTGAAVADRADPRWIMGEITLHQWMRARRRDLQEEECRERFLCPSALAPRHAGPGQAAARDGRRTASPDSGRSRSASAAATSEMTPSRENATL